MVYGAELMMMAALFKRGRGRIGRCVWEVTTKIRREGDCKTRERERNAGRAKTFLDDETKCIRSCY